MFIIAQIYKEHYNTDINYGADVTLSTNSDIMFVTERYNKSSRTNKICKVTAKIHVLVIITCSCLPALTPNYTLLYD